MRNFKKYLAFVLTVAMLVTAMAPMAIAVSDDYANEARDLYDLGLFTGRSETEYVPDLESTLTRQEGAILLLRMFGLEQDAEDLTSFEARQILRDEFSDHEDVDVWAAKQVAYAVQNGVIAGFPDGTFGPLEPLTGRQYVTLTLRQLGYDDFEFEDAGKTYGDITGIPFAQEREFEVDEAITRGTVVGISFTSLTVPMEDGTGTLADSLVRTNVINAAAAEDRGVYTPPSEPEEPELEVHEVVVTTDEETRLTTVEAHVVGFEEGQTATLTLTEDFATEDVVVEDLEIGEEGLVSYTFESRLPAGTHVVTVCVEDVCSIPAMFLIEELEGIVVDSVVAIDAETLHVNFEGADAPVDVVEVTDFEPSPLEFGENEVTFTYEEEEYTVEVYLADPDALAVESVSVRNLSTLRVSFTGADAPGLPVDIVNFTPRPLNQGTNDVTFTYHGVEFNEEVEVASDELAIDDVISITEKHQWLRVTFTQPVSEVNPADVTFTNTENFNIRVVEAVNLASDGSYAHVHVLATQEDEGLESQTEYELTMFADGVSLSTVFDIPEYKRGVVQEVNAVERELTLNYLDNNDDNRDEELEVHEDLDVDFERLLGREIRVWYDADNVIDRIVEGSYDIYVDAVEVDTSDREIELLGADTVLDLSGSRYYNDTIEDNHILRLDGEVEGYNLTVGAILTQLENSYSTSDYGHYAKITIDSENRIFVDAYQWDGLHIVDSVEDGILYAKGGDELNISDFVIIRNGHTISCEDLEEYDVFYYNDSADNSIEEQGFAEVFNSHVSGEITHQSDTRLRVGGDDYVYDDISGYHDFEDVAQFLDGDSLDEVDRDEVERFREAGPVTLFLDRAGNMVFLSGERAELQLTGGVAILTRDVTFFEAGTDIYELEMDFIDETGEEHEEIRRRARNLESISFDSDDEDDDDYVMVFEVGENFPTKASSTAGIWAVSEGSIDGGTATVAGIDSENPITFSSIEAVSTDAISNDNYEIDYFEVKTASDNERYLVAFNKNDEMLGIVPVHEYANDGDIFEYSLNSDGNIEELVFFNNWKVENGKVILAEGLTKFAYDDDYVTVSTSGISMSSIVTSYVDLALQDDTLVFWMEDDDEDDLEIFEWSEASAYFEEVTNADVYFNEDRDITYIYVRKTDYEADTTEFKALIVDSDTDDGDLIWVKAAYDGMFEDLDVASSQIGDSEDDIVGNVDTDNQVSLVKLLLNDDNGEIEKIESLTGYAIGASTSDEITGGAIHEVRTGSNRTVNISGSALPNNDITYRLRSDGYVYDARDTSDVEIESLSWLSSNVKGENYKIVLVRASKNTTDLDMIIVLPEGEDVQLPDDDL